MCSFDLCFPAQHIFKSLLLVAYKLRRLFTKIVSASTCKILELKNSFTKSLQPSPWQGGRCDPLIFFCDARRAMRRIVLKFCIWGILCATFGEKKIDWVMSDHGAMTSQGVQGQTIFARNSGIWHIRRRYRGFF